MARCLEGLGHEVIVADPGFAPMYGMRRRRVKTDVRISTHAIRIIESDLGTYVEKRRVRRQVGTFARGVPDPAPYLVVVAPWRCSPSARITFITVANSGLPSGESAL